MRPRALLLALSLMTIGCTEQRRRPVICELTPGYRGWVRVFFDDKSCSPSSVHEEVRVLVNRDGRGCTSEPFEEGSALDEVFFRRADGSKETLKRKENMFGGAIHRVTIAGVDVISWDFFVGTPEEFSVARRPTP